MLDKMKLSFLIVIQSFFILTAVPAMAEEASKNTTPAAPAAPTAPSHPAGPSLISANGFSCSMLEGRTQCQGKFEDADRDLVIGATGMGEITLRVQKRGTLYTYASGNGCLCETDKNDIKCKNSHGKDSKFKGDKRQQESASFCALKK